LFFLVAIFTFACGGGAPAPSAGGSSGTPPPPGAAGSGELIGQPLRSTSEGSNITSVTLQPGGVLALEFADGTSLVGSWVGGRRLYTLTYPNKQTGGNYRYTGNVDTDGCLELSYVSATYCP
jgi:hypothetical protein